MSTDKTGHNIFEQRRANRSGIAEPRLVRLSGLPRLARPAHRPQTPRWHRNSPLFLGTGSSYDIIPPRRKMAKSEIWTGVASSYVGTFSVSQSVKFTPAERPGGWWWLEGVIHSEKSASDVCFRLFSASVCVRYFVAAVFHYDTRWTSCFHWLIHSDRYFIMSGNSS